MRRVLFVFLPLLACSSAPPSERTQVLVRDGGTEDAGGAGFSDSGADASVRGDASTADTGASHGDSGAADASSDAGAGDGGDGCFLTDVGVYGQCEETTTCAAMSGYTSTPGYCPGPADIECCTLAPNVANNPPVPAGWELMQQADVTTAMTDWAVMILDAPATYPMFSTTTQYFGTLDVLARVEWHPPDFQNAAVHRGVTLYQPIDEQ